MTHTRSLVVLLLVSVAFLYASTPLFAISAIPGGSRDTSNSGIIATMTTLNPAADAYVNSAYPTTNYGMSAQLRVDASPVTRSYLRFSVQLVSGPISKATLRIYANSSQTTGYTASRVSSNTWSESTITYGNAPAIGSAIGSSGAVTAGTWTSVDVTPYVTGNGTYSFGLTTSNSTALSLASRESTNKPQLVIVTGASTTSTSLSTATTTTSATPVPLGTW